MKSPIPTRPNQLVQHIHFEDFGGEEFERLVFAYHVRAGWKDVEWYGQTGSDLGRDIAGTETFDGRSPQRTVIQCANRKALTKAKADADMRKAIKSPMGKPDAFKFICRGNVTSAMRDAIRASAKSLGIVNVTIWSGVDFEEHLRLIGEDLLRRFCAGEAFPDGASEIKSFVDDFPALSDDDALAMMAAVFNGSAFTTPFSLESSLPGFMAAIEDTIGALNTGIWCNREGAEIRRIPSLHNLKAPTLKAGVEATVAKVDHLRRLFVGYLRSKDVRPCGCGNPDCSTFVLTEKAAHQLDAARREIWIRSGVSIPSSTCG